MKTKRETAKAIAFRDIAEECRRLNQGVNYLLYESEILTYLGIPKPDFRYFNGGKYNKINAIC